MNNLTETLKNFTQKDYAEKKINLHIHTKHSDGEGNGEQIIKSAKEKGYKLISITDHNTVEVHKQIKDDILLTGVEFDCWFGYVFIHLLAYGIDIENHDIYPFLAKDKSKTDHMLPRLFSFPNVAKLINAIHSAGGIAVLAHPACYWALSLERLVKNLEIPVILEGRIWEVEEVKRAFDMGTFAVVIGSAVTRPQHIVKRFLNYNGEN